MTATTARIEAPPPLPPIVHFLVAVETGQWDGIGEHLAPDVIYDASTPEWRSRLRGAERVAREYTDEWAKHSWRFVERHVALTHDGAVVDFELRGRCAGDEHHGAHDEAVRMANIFRLAGGRIAEHRVYCCGEWDETTLRRVEQEAMTIGREET